MKQRLMVAIGAMGLWAAVPAPVQAGDFGFISARIAAKKAVGPHAYQSGSHRFGLGQPGTTTLTMPEFLLWMESQGLLDPKVNP